MLQDTRFLQEHGFLDYSLLIGIEKTDFEFDMDKAMQSKRITRGIVKFNRRVAMRSTDQVKKRKLNVPYQSSALLARQDSLHKLLRV